MNELMKLHEKHYLKLLGSYKILLVMEFSFHQNMILKSQDIMIQIGHDVQ